MNGTEDETIMEKGVNEAEEPGRQMTTERRRSRRGLFRKGLGVTAAILGAGALLQKSPGVAHANGNEGPTTFTSNTNGTPAVTANGTNGANGVNAISDSGNGLFALSSSENSIHTIGPGFLSTGIRAGIYAEGGTGYGVLATSTSGTSVIGFNDTAIALQGQSTSGIGVLAESVSGPALVAKGPVQVQGTSVGQATLLAGKTSVTVTSSAATASSNILLTPLGNPLGNLWVTRAAGSFTIHASKAPPSNLSIAYLIIN